MEHCAQLVGIAFVKRVEIALHHGFDARTVIPHASLLPWQIGATRDRRVRPRKPPVFCSQKPIGKGWLTG
jgi:hypothetical protein